VVHVLYVDDAVATKQNLTVQLDRETIRRAKVMAAKRGTSISGLIASQIRESVEAESAYEAARRAALELLARGFHFGGDRLNREALHER
jgi:predicted transcriptional regulator